MKTLTQAGILAEAHALARARRERMSACVTEIKAAGEPPDADVVAAAIARHLDKLKPGELPPTANALWHERIARPLKSDPARPLTQRAVASIRSWPSVRIMELVAAFLELERLLTEAENDAHNEVIFAEISRAYS